MLQWSHDYGGDGHAQLAQPVGDLDKDGVNEVVVGGYETQGTLRILSYVGGTYVQEFSMSPTGGSYNCPSGATIVDLDGDGTLELVVSWAYTSNDGVYAYHWDGTTLTTLDEYHGTGVNFVFDVYSCDYNEDGSPEVLIANAPWGASQWYVTGLLWQSGHFVRQASWACPSGNGGECPIVWSGDVDNDGHPEIIADISYGTSYTYGTWALNWNAGTTSWTGVPVWTAYGSNTVYGDSVGDIDGDGTPEIGIGTYGGTPTGYLFEWDGSAFQKVWQQSWPDGQPIIEAVAIGDADNDGHKEFCVGAGHVHVIGWDGSQDVEEAVFTQPAGMLAGMNIGDFDTDGHNEVKGCEILSNTGYEFIWKYVDTTPPVTTFHWDGQQFWFTAVDNGTGVNHTMYRVDAGEWTLFAFPVAFNDSGVHTVYYYSVDHVGNVETTKSSSIYIGPKLQVALKGGVGITLEVENLGISDLTNIPWSLSLKGGLILSKREPTGMFSLLKPGVNVTKKILVLGFGKFTASALVNETRQNATGAVFLVFVKMT